MNGKRENPLKAAADLIRKGKPDKARPILVDLLRTDSNNAQAWFLLSYSLVDPQRRQYALLQALRVDPQFERARQRLSALRDEGLPPISELPKGAQAFAEPGPLAVTNAQTETKPSRAERLQTGTDKGRARGLRRALIAMIVILLCILTFVAGRPFFANIFANVRPTATVVVPFKTLPATWTPSP